MTVGAKLNRYNNLMRLINLHGQKGLATFADLAPAHVSQMATHARGIGDTVARRIEEKMSLPPGWMDDSHEEGVEGQPVAEAPADLAAIFRLWMSLPESTRKHYLAIISDHARALAGAHHEAPPFKESTRLPSGNFGESTTKRPLAKKKTKKV